MIYFVTFVAFFFLSRLKLFQNLNHYYYKITKTESFFSFLSYLTNVFCGKINQILFDNKSDFLKTFSYIARTTYDGKCF